jgi:tetratricopeptide (TPR) repeat protein
MDEIVNPYIAGAPVTEKRMFFGREDIFQWIENSIAGQYADHILVIHGQRRVGKTSVLKQLGNRLPKRYIPVFFDLQGRTHTTLDRFLWWLAREIVRVLKQECNVQVPPPEKETFSKDLEHFENRFLPDIKPVLNGGTLLLTFDEFDNLEESEVREELARPLVDYLRRLMGQDGLNFIFSIGSSGRKLENMQAAYTEFFKTALYKKISFLSEDQTHNLVTKPVQGVLDYEPAAVDRIYAIASGHPYFTQLTCHELFARCQRTQQRRITSDDVEAILDDVVERGTVNLKFVWDEASDIEKWSLAALADMNKSDARSLADYLRKVRVRFSESDLTSGLLHLREKDVLTSENQFVIQLLKRWLQKNRPIEQVREELTEVNPIANRYIEIGLEYRDAELYEKAVNSFQEALTISKDNVQAQVNIALTYMDQKLHEKAVLEFEKALAMDDEDVSARAGLCEVHMALGDAAMEKGRARDAVRSYQRVLGINGEHTEARGRMAELSRQRAEKALTDGRDEEALLAFTEALKYTPEDAALNARADQVRAEKKASLLANLLARSEREAGARDWQGAVKSLEEAFTLSPADEDIRHQLEDARAAFGKEQALAAIYMQAQKAYAERNYDAAVSQFKKIVLEDENYRDASRLLAQAIELRRTAPRWWQKKTVRTVTPRPRLHIGGRKLWLTSGLAVLALGIGGVLFWLGKDVLPAISNPMANHTATIAPILAATPTPEPRMINPVLYQYVNREVTWHDARDHCAAWGGRLATIQDAGENEYIFNLAGGAPLWLGATDAEKEGNWEWITGETWDYTKWGALQPDNFRGDDSNGENYLSMGSYGSDASHWNDAHGEARMSFVCEWDSVEARASAFQAALEVIQNEEPLYQTAFDAWEFGEPIGNASIEDGKLVVAGGEDGIKPEPVLLTYPTNSFAVEFDFQIRNTDPANPAEPAGQCIFNADNGIYDDEAAFWVLSTVFLADGGVWGGIHAADGGVWGSIHVADGVSGVEGGYDKTIPHTVLIIALEDQAAVFMDGQIALAFNYGIDVVYRIYTLVAQYQIACEYDNFKYWDLRKMDPAVKTALAAIQNKEPDYQTGFDDANQWEFDNDARIENGKLIVPGDGIAVGNALNSLGTDTFAIEFDIQLSDASPDGHCNISFSNNGDKELDRWLVTGFFSPGNVNLARSLSSNGQEDLAYSTFDSSISNNVKLFILGDQIAAFINGQLAYTAINPNGRVVYLSNTFAGANKVLCEFNNYKLWDLSGVDFSTSTETTPAPTTSAAQGPAWVTDFAEPILAAIKDRSPDFQDDFSLNDPRGWPRGWFGGENFSIVDGEMLINDDFVVNTNFNFMNNYVLQLDAGCPHSGCVSVKISMSNEGWGEGSRIDLCPNEWLVCGTNNTCNSIGHSYNNGQLIQLTIIVRKTHVGAYFQEIPATYFTDPDLAGGFFTRPSINCFGFSCKFDNVKFWNLDKVPNLP